jgi:hypothetical protein
MSSEQVLPADVFSRRRRELMENPGAMRSASTVNVQDFYGNLETWHIETFRTDATVEALVQRNSADGSLRLVLPPKVMEALNRQRGQVVTQARKRAARRAVDTRRERGDVIGNPEALRQARKATKRKGVGR